MRDIDDSFERLNLSKFSEDFYVPLGGWMIRLIKTGVEAEILFQETESDLTVQVREYVQEWYKEVLEACKSAGRWGFYSRLSGAQKEGVLTAEESRMLNSLSGGTRNQSVNQYYFAADIDNDGIEEYGHAELGSDGRVTFYEKENGEFRAVPFKEVFPDHDVLTGSEAETVAIWQLWCEKLGDTTYLFTVEDLEYAPDYCERRQQKLDGQWANLLEVSGYTREHIYLPISVPRFRYARSLYILVGKYFRCRV